MSNYLLKEEGRENRAKQYLTRQKLRTSQN